MKIIFIPLDERPCNYKYPKMIAETRDDVELLIPPYDIMGKKKTAANVEKVWDFIFENIHDCDAVVLSIETLLYGGLIPSRLHYLTKEKANDLLDNIKKIKEINKDISVYASNMIMRTPRYSSDDEEPDYYGICGLEIFQRAYYTDKKARVGISEEEQIILDKAIKNVKQEYIDDYETRREFNSMINGRILELVKEGSIDFLSITQDDSARFGYTARDQQKVVKKLKEYKLWEKVMMYPGADEVGCTLISRALNHLLNREPEVYCFFSSTNGPMIIPNYEDRPMNETLKSHILAAGCKITENLDNADFILAINSPGQKQEEAPWQENKDVTYSSFRNLLDFSVRIKNYIKEGRPVVISDSAFSNGGDIELLQILDEMNVCDKLISYKGWNTNANTLGTTIAAGVYGFEKLKEDKIKENVLFHVLEDCMYQSIVRQYFVDHVLPKYDCSYGDLGDKTEIITKLIAEEMKEKFNALILKSFTGYNDVVLEVDSPCNRMFEIDLNIDVK
ncbi:DUF4127 family protein [Mycoplasmatota bacterium]|nr:DUF4127 family protein [Mycoplasmatota bacterium]